MRHSIRSWGEDDRDRARCGADVSAIEDERTVVTTLVQCADCKRILKVERKRTCIMCGEPRGIGGMGLYCRSCADDTSDETMHAHLRSL